MYGFNPNTKAGYTMTPKSPEDWQNYIANKLRDNEKRMEDMQDELSANTRLTAKLVADRLDLEPERIAQAAADKAAAKVFDTVHIYVGKTLMNKLFYLIGVAAVVAAGWLASKGVIKP